MPLVQLALFLSFTAILEGGSPARYIKEKWLSIIKHGLIVWPLANFINFKWIPSGYRVLYVNVIGMGWNTYLSCASHDDELHE